MRESLIVLSILLLSFTVHTQSCLPDEIVFDTQEQVDSFPIDYPGCTRIEGAVTINAAIENLRVLSQITYIGGFLKILNTDHLVNFDGLENLEHVGGKL